MVGFLSVNSSYRVHAVRFWKQRFRVYPLVDNAYAHIFLGSLLSNNRHRAMSKPVLQLCSAVPFCCGVYGALRSCIIEWWTSISLKLPYMYSPPLSVRTLLISPICVPHQWWTVLWQELCRSCVSWSSEAPYRNSRPKSRWHTQIHLWPLVK